MKLVIQNLGIAPVEAYTLLGASLSRNETGLIGQFGSGSKLAITTLLRAGLSVVIYCGKTRLTFKTKHIEIEDGITSKQEQQVYIQFGGTSTKKVDLGWVLGMGALDWKTDVNMAIREFVANAIDHTIKGGGNVRDAHMDRDLAIEIVPDESMRAQDGYTRVYIEANEEVQNYVDELPKRFLHFTSTDLGRQILPKLSDNRKAQVYYNGVFVRELTNSADSLFDYNFTGTQIKIDESRNLDEYQARAAIGRLFRDAGVADLAKMFKALSEAESWLETGLDTYYVSPNAYEGATEKQRDTWRDAWAQVNGDKVACGHDQGIVGEFARRKGHSLAVIKATAFLGVLRDYGVGTVSSVLDDNERKGRTITLPTAEALAAVDEVWSWIAATDLLDQEKCPKPLVKGFDEIADGETEALGFYMSGGDSVYLRNDLAGPLLLETALEEVTHYVTGATDCSRDFQGFIMRLLIRWMTV
jgi:hypothetical protein